MTTTRFTKVIATEGKYRTFDQSTGRKTLKELSKSQLEKATQTFEKMQSKGLKVPAPWKHDFGINAFTKIETGNDGLLKDSNVNAGFWDKLYTKIDPKTKKTQLIGEIEVPGTPEDHTSPASKVGTSVKDTSIYLRPKYEMTDESGEVLEDVLMHIALVTHPIEPNQKNFEKLPQNDDLYIAMSDMLEDEEESSTNFKELSSLLSEVVKVFLPSSTTEDNLVSNLTIALQQMKLCMKDDDEDGDGKDPSSTSFKTEPVIMAQQFSQAQLEVLTKTIDPSTGKPFTLESFQVKEEQKPDANNNIVMSMQNYMQDQKRQQLRSQINSLVETGRTPKEYADAQLYPQADNYTLQFANGNPISQPIDAIVMSLAALPAKTPERSTGQIEYGIEVADELNNMSDADMDKIADDLLSTLNF